jgi:hypothetical protein
MTGSQAAAMTFSLVALLLTFCLWFGRYRFLRSDLLEAELLTLRDDLFDSALRGELSLRDPALIATLAWLETLASQVHLLSVGRLILVRAYLSQSLRCDSSKSAGLFLRPVVVNAVKLVQCHLFWGCPVLILVPYMRLDEEVLASMLASGRS